MLRQLSATPLMVPVILSMDHFKAQPKSSSTQLGMRVKTAPEIPRKKNRLRALLF